MSSHPSVKGIPELLLSRGGLHQTEFVLGFQGERDTPLRLSALGLSETVVEDKTPVLPRNGFPVALLCGWVRRIGVHLWRPALAPRV